MATKKISKNISKKINKKTKNISRLNKKLNVKKRVTKLKGSGRLKNWWRTITGKSRIATITPETATAQAEEPEPRPVMTTAWGPAPAEPQLKQKGVKTIKHFWYREWPDHGAPNLKNSHFIDFVDDLLNDIKLFEVGTVIHCSAGVGRTGTLFVILKICLERKKLLSELLEDKSIKIEQTEIDNAITYARLRRANLVQDFTQYEFLLKLFSADTSLGINKDTFILKQKDETFPLRITHKYNKNNNRYSNILPYVDTIVEIPNVPYINANYLNTEVESNNCDEPDEDMFKLCVDKTHIFNGTVIGAQGPKPNTIQNFLRMLDDDSLNIKRIVMLTGLLEKDKKTEKYIDKCADYTTGDKTLSKLVHTKGTYGNKTNFDLVHNGLNYELTNGRTIEHSSPQVGSIIGTEPPPFSIQPDIQENTSVLNKEDVIKRLTDFLNAKIGNIDPELNKISFCDCKMILLYLISYAEILELIPDKIEEYKSSFLTKYIMSSGLNKNSSSENTKIVAKILKLVYQDILGENYVPKYKRIQFKDFFNFLKRETEIQAYKILFGVSEDLDFNKIVTNMECIFDGSGNVIEGLKFDTLGNPFDLNFSCESSA